MNTCPRSFWLPIVLALVILAPAALAEVTIDWVVVGDPGNACETQQSQGCFGAVAAPYRISKTEVTNVQYAEFLNAVATTDSNALYNTGMGSGSGGITRSGSSGSYSYSTIAGRENMPVIHVSFWDATRFANWLHNGQPTGAQDATTTEGGAYTLTPTGIANNTVTRNAGAAVFVTSEDEWYKAAYYDTGAMLYFDYPAGSDTQITCASPGATTNSANCDNVVGDLTAVGSYAGWATNPNGTFDQGGNVWEWNEAIVGGSYRVLRGGSAFSNPGVLAAVFRFDSFIPSTENGVTGFRVASPHAVEITIEWVAVGDPGNACDTQSQGCFGAVAAPYRISKTEVTNAQYAAFLNAVATTDTNALYNTSMGLGIGGITRSGISGSYIYSAITGRENMPVIHVSFWDATRFANWLHNGQPTGAQDATTTEDGAYTLTPTGIANNTVTRNAGAAVFVTSEDEWYKAAYYDTGAMLYFDYPAGSDTQTTCALPGPTANTANCNGSDLTDVGSYTGAASPNGTFDQGGNVYEWNEAIVAGSYRSARGGSLFDTSADLAASFQGSNIPAFESVGHGFRVASSVPAPAVPSLGPLGVTMLWSLLGLVGWRRLRA